LKLGHKPKLTDHQKREAIRRRDRDGETVREIARGYRLAQHDFPARLDFVFARPENDRDRRNISRRQADPLRKSRRAPRCVSTCGSRQRFGDALAGLSGLQSVFSAPSRPSLSGLSGKIVHRAAALKTLCIITYRRCNPQRLSACKAYPAHAY
jgi:hypothetical protein